MLVLKWTKFLFKNTQLIQNLSSWNSYTIWSCLSSLQISTLENNFSISVRYTYYNIILPYKLDFGCV